MFSVDQIADGILAREGGYTNDPDDPGGPTNHGVTLATLQRLGRDVDGNGRVDADDVRKLTREEARRIYLQHYYHGPGVDRLPQPVQAPVFDMYVNSGDNAVRILQRLLNDMGNSLVVDGIIGPKTAAAAALAQSVAAAFFADAYGIARRNWYYALADRRPALRKFARRKDGGKGGWITRAEEFISARYRLTEAEHRRRVAAWG